MQREQGNLTDLLNFARRALRSGSVTEELMLKFAFFWTSCDHFCMDVRTCCRHCMPPRAHRWPSAPN